MPRWSCFSATYLGPAYPGGLFGAIDCGEETALRFFRDWNDQVRIQLRSKTEGAKSELYF